MASNDVSYLGIDLAYKYDFDTIETGDTALTLNGLHCLAQDLRLALTTPKGDLWYAPLYGVDIYKYLKNENTEINRLAIALEVVVTIEDDPRVVSGSARCQVTRWDLHGICLQAECQPLGETNRLNLVLNYSSGTLSAEVK